MTENYAIMIHFKISITTVNEPGWLFTRDEERKLRNFEQPGLLVTNKKQFVWLHLQSVLYNYFSSVVRRFVHGEIPKIIIIIFKLLKKLLKRTTKFISLRNNIIFSTVSTKSRYKTCLWLLPARIRDFVFVSMSQTVLGPTQTLFDEYRRSQEAGASGW
jgi:hypothetical protein